MKRILVMNFFPAFVPPASGGELRYFNLYSKLSAFFDITLLSPTYADHKFEIITHSKTFREYRIPKEISIHNRMHHKLDQEGVCAEVSALVCALSSAHPNKYHTHYLKLHEKADIIVHESPYMVEYDMLWGFDGKPRVYNSYNIEYLLMKQLYRSEKRDAYLDYIFALEKKVALESDLVFATCKEESDAFTELYGVPPGKITLIPNGIDPLEVNRISKEGRKSALFIGSPHPPNIEAVDFIIRNVAPQCKAIDFLIAGDCCNSFMKKSCAENVHLLGRVDEKTKKDLFMNVDVALNPMFSGAGTNLKTLEFLSAGIPLISSDIGVRGLGLHDGEHFVRADKELFAKKILELIGNAPLREKISRSGRLYVAEHYSWENISQTARDALDRLPLSRRGARKRILLLNDFSAARPTSGGEMRINRLYSELSRYHDILLLCLNNSSRILQSRITRTFTEISFPKTEEHASEQRRVDDQFWKSAADIVSSYMVGKNDSFTEALSVFSRTADAVILIHPYMLQALKTEYKKPLIYESLNFEYQLKKDLLKDHPLFDRLITQVESVEKAACNRSSLVLGVSHDDIARLIEFSNISAVKTYVVGNGVDVKDEIFFLETHDEVKKILSGRRSILFIGSGHGPNVTALDFIIHSLAPTLPHCVFLIIGTVCNAFRRSEVPKNVLLFGQLDEAYKEVLLRIADVAINPMAEGSGSNLKLAEYIAYQLPTVTTEMGARGYDVENGREALICGLPEFAGTIERLLGDSETFRTISELGYEYARRNLDWAILADNYASILGNTVFRGERAKLLVLTYRFTSPPLGGAEVYLLNVLKELDRLGDFAITIATLGVHDIANKFHFSAEYGYDNSVLPLPDMNNTVVYKFRCDRISDERKLENARRLFERWMDEFVHSSLRHLDKYDTPLLMGGWHFPEYNSGRCEIWSSGTSLIYIAGTDEVQVNGFCLRADTLTIESDIKTFDARQVSGTFSVSLMTSGCRWLKLSVGVFEPPHDSRQLGVRIYGIKLKAEGRWRDLRLNYNYRDYLKERYPVEYIEELIAIAESRPAEFDTLFQYTRGPVSAELEHWLDRNTGRFDIVLGHGVPFSTSVLAAAYARKHNKPLMILPHFHVDDEFYHWKSYYEALQNASVVLAFPRSSIDLFFNKIRAKAVYIPGGGIDPKEYESIDASDFSNFYNKRLPFFLVLGRKAGAKNYRWAIDAVRRLNTHKKICELVIIGRDEDDVKIPEGDALYFGESDRRVVLGALKECTALINMSESESFGIVILEAWMQKKPVIVNEKCGAFVELVKDGVNGLLANRDNLPDKIRAVLRDPQQAREMGEKGFEEVSTEFTWESIGKEADELCKALAELKTANP